MLGLLIIFMELCGQGYISLDKAARWKFLLCLHLLDDVPKSIDTNEMKLVLVLF
jgi:hypothetical protein